MFTKMRGMVHGELRLAQGCESQKHCKRYMGFVKVGTKPICDVDIEKMICLGELKPNVIEIKV